MKDATSTLPKLFGRCMKHYIEELRDRDDYEARITEGKCPNCRGKVLIPEYRIFGQENWKSAYENKELQCKVCTDQKELAKIFDENNIVLRQKLIKRFNHEYWNIPEDLKDAGFKNFLVESEGNVFDAKRDTMDFAKTFAQEPEKRYNLIILGNPGTGKTHLATAIARTLKEQGFIVGQLTTGSLLSKIKATYQKGATKNEEEIFDDLQRFELLVLDDLGSEAKSKEEFDWSKNKLFEIVNLRIGQPTIYTSNFSEDYLPTAIGERVFSRLYNNTKFINLVTDDYRKKFQIK